MDLRLTSSVVPAHPTTNRRRPNQFTGTTFRGEWLAIIGPLVVTLLEPLCNKTGIRRAVRWVFREGGQPPLHGKPPEPRLFILVLDLGALASGRTMLHHGFTIRIDA